MSPRVFSPAEAIASIKVGDHHVQPSSLLSLWRITFKHIASGAHKFQLMISSSHKLRFSS